MKEEIFGPILPIRTFNKLDEVIDHINAGDKPLAIYYFGKVIGSNPNKDRLINETSSGGFLTNDAITHSANHEIGFGGVGASGYGRYGGYEGFKQWSNPKGVMIKPTMNFYPYTLMRPPYSQNNQNLIRKGLDISST